MKTFLPLFALALLATGGCTRVATPVDVHTQYVANVLVSPSCLTLCDHTGDGLIQYRLWPGTETPSIDEPGAIVYGITEGHGPLDDEVAEKDKKLAKELAKDDPEANPYAEYACWQQCRGPQPTMRVASDSAMLPVAGSGSAGMADDDAKMTEKTQSAETESLPY